MRVCILHLLLTLFLFTAQAAAEPGTEQSQTTFSPSVGFSASVSPTSYRAWGKMENTTQAYLKIQYLHSGIEFGGISLRLSSEIVGAGYIRYPIDGADAYRESVYGAGIIPLRINLPFSAGPNHPFLTSSAGVLYTNRNFPDYRGTRLNYTLELGAGYQFSAGERTLVQAGYNFHHLSNGNQGSENPGIDSHMFFVNLLFRL